MPVRVDRKALETRRKARRVAALAGNPCFAYAAGLLVPVGIGEVPDRLPDKPLEKRVVFVEFASNALLGESGQDGMRSRMGANRNEGMAGNRASLCLAQKIARVQCRQRNRRLLEDRFEEALATQVPVYPVLDGGQRQSFGGKRVADEAPAHRGHVDCVILKKKVTEAKPPRVE